jgi:N-acetylmuramoyl-L-alanine amidase
MTIRALWAFSWLLAGAMPAAALYESPAFPAAAQAASLSRSVILDPGHGGQDLGAVVGGRREKDIALAISRRVKEKLEAMGALPVRLTRDSDIFIPLDQRVAESLETESLAFVSLHVDQVRSRKQHGIRVFAFGKNPFRYRRRAPRVSKVPPLPPPPAEEAEESNALAASLVNSLRAQGFRVEPPAKAGFYVLKNPNIPSVLIEMGYLSNPKEAARLNDPAYQDRLAEAVAVSLQSYFMAAMPSAAAGR